jgi:hypothetical protein
MDAAGGTEAGTGAGEDRRGHHLAELGHVLWSQGSLCSAWDIANIRRVKGMHLIFPPPFHAVCPCDASGGGCSGSGGGGEWAAAAQRHQGLPHACGSISLAFRAFAVDLARALAPFADTLEVQPDLCYPLLPHDMRLAAILSGAEPDTRRTVAYMRLASARTGVCLAVSFTPRPFAAAAELLSRQQQMLTIRNACATALRGEACGYLLGTVLQNVVVRWAAPGCPDLDLDLDLDLALDLDLDLDLDPDPDPDPDPGQDHGEAPPLADLFQQLDAVACRQQLPAAGLPSATPTLVSPLYSVARHVSHLALKDLCGVVCNTYTALMFVNGMLPFFGKFFAASELSVRVGQDEVLSSRDRFSGAGGRPPCCAPPAPLQHAAGAPLPPPRLDIEYERTLRWRCAAGVSRTAAVALPRAAMPQATRARAAVALDLYDALCEAVQAALGARVASHEGLAECADLVVSFRLVPNARGVRALAVGPLVQEVLQLLEPAAATAMGARTTGGRQRQADFNFPLRFLMDLCVHTGGIPVDACEAADADALAPALHHIRAAGLGGGSAAALDMLMAQGPAVIKALWEAQWVLTYTMDRARAVPLLVARAREHITGSQAFLAALYGLRVHETSVSISCDLEPGV